MNVLDEQKDLSRKEVQKWLAFEGNFRFFFSILKCCVQLSVPFTAVQFFLQVDPTYAMVSSLFWWWWGKIFWWRFCHHKDEIISLLSAGGDFRTRISTLNAFHKVRNSMVYDLNTLAIVLVLFGGTNGVLMPRDQQIQYLGIPLYFSPIYTISMRYRYFRAKF